MSRMKDRLQRQIDDEERFKSEVERDSYKGRVLIECATELAGYYTGTKFLDYSDQQQWQDECRY
jgi:hypothetical protein